MRPSLSEHGKKKSAGKACPERSRRLARAHTIHPDLRVNQFHSVDRVPTGGSFQLVVDVVDVLDAFGFEPLAEGGCALFGVDRDAVLPGGAAAQDAVELYAGFSGEFEGLAELG